MKISIYLFIAFFSLCAQMAIAQGPVFTSASAPAIGEVFTIQPVHLGNINPGGNGPNQTWTISAMDSGASYDIHTIDPATTPGAAAYPGATICQTTYLSDTSYAYDQVTASAYTYSGGYSTGVSVHYDPHIVAMQYPFSYGHIFANSYAGTSSQGDSITGIDSVIADGYGTLVLPFHTYTDVLRTKRISRQHSINSGFGFFFDIYQVEYVYSTPAIHNYIFDIAYSTTSANGAVISATTAFYTKSVSTGINETSNVAELVIYPQPAQNSFVIKGFFEKGELVISTLEGKIVHQERLQSNEQSIDVAYLSAGMYVLKMLSNQGNITRKLLIE